ncbi:MAG TPA: type IV pilus secretin PilQ [Rhodocyclaceae bacterium]|jgi:type IV pilus assembly protein PilQ
MIFRKGLTWFASLLALVAATNVMAAGNAIENVEFSQQGAQTLVKVVFQSPLEQVPATFSTSNPYRVVFDFPEVESKLGVLTKQAGLGGLQSVSVIQGSGRTRVVLNLSGPAQQTTTVEGNLLYITLTSDTSSTKNIAAAPLINSDKTGSKQPDPVVLITGVDFQANGLDQASIKIELTDPNALLDVKQQGDSLVMFIAKADAQQKLLKKLDVRDFGTPISTLVTSKTANGVQVVLMNRGEWDYSVRQIDTSIVLDVRRIVVDPTTLASSKDVQGKVVSFNFTQPVPVSQMIGIFQDITGLNFIVMPGVAGEIQSIKMDNTPVETAIDIISRMYGLGFRRYGNVVVVGKADDLVKYDKEERDRVVAMANSEPIQQETFKIKYRTAGDIVQRLTSNASPSSASSTGAAAQTPATPAPQGTNTQTGVNGANTSIISERGSITYDNATNTVFVEETKTRLGKIRERIMALDRPMRQVMIEARLVEVSDTFFSSLGVKLSGGKLGYTIGNTAADATFGTFTTSQSLGAGTGASPASLAFSLFNSTQTRIVNLELDAVESDAKSKTIASPKILTRDTQKATLMHGEQIPYATVSTSGTQTTFINAAITLDVTPQIQQDGRVQMNLSVTMDSRGQSAGTAGFAINKRQVATQVVVENGGTVVVGGMYKQVDSNTEERIPFLGDLPYVGFLFKNKVDNKTRNELLVFITPRVVSEELVLQ